MSSPLFVGIDAGTQGVKVLVWDQSTGRIASRSSQTYGILPTNVPGRAEQHPSTWIDVRTHPANAGITTRTRQATRTALRTALASVNTSAVRGIGVSGQQHGLVALDAQGEPLRPAKLWCDVEAAAEAEELSKVYGIATPPGFTAPKLLWWVAIFG